MRTLRIAFDSPEALSREYADNIANGGIFVETNVGFEVREAVRVEIELTYKDELIELDGEIVHVVPPELAGGGARAGVAVHFAERASDLRERFANLIGPAQASEDEAAQSGSGVRRSRRISCVLDAHVETPDGTQLIGETRNVSRGGALVNIDEDAAVDVGDVVRLSMTRPESGASVRVDARVVRSQTGDDKGMGLGVEFEAPGDELEEVGEFVDEVRVDEHKKKLGGISGAIAELGIEHLLQMFCTCSPQGTLTVFRGDEEGFAIFEGGLVRAVRLGPAKGRKALARMLEWRDGRFEFHANADLDGIEDDPLPLDAALIDAMRLMDESQRCEVVDFPPEARFQVNADAIAAAGSELSKGEAAILELAQVGMNVERILDIVPEPDAEIVMSMSGLVERGLITVVE